MRPRHLTDLSERIACRMLRIIAPLNLRGEERAEFLREAATAIREELIAADERHLRELDRLGGA